MTLIDPGLDPAVLEARVRRTMAARAALPTTWQNRRMRAAMLADISAWLEEYNLLVLGR